jgi:hypothetical protein
MMVFYILADLPENIVHEVLRRMESLANTGSWTLGPGVVRRHTGRRYANDACCGRADSHRMQRT